MALFNSRRRLRHVERHLARLDQHITRIADALGRSNPADHHALGEIVSQMVDSQAKQLNSSTEFLRAIHAIAVDRAAQALGRKGGKKNAATANRSRGGQFAPKLALTGCVLCANPMTANFTLEQFHEHQRHQGNPPPPPRAPIETTATSVDEQGGHYHADGSWHFGPHEQAAATPTYPLPVLTTPWSEAPAAADGNQPNGSAQPSAQPTDTRGPNGSANS